jgi:RNA polymerase-binding transcription factor DksA
VDDGGAIGRLATRPTPLAALSEMEISLMRIRKNTSRASKRQEILRELAADDVAYAISGTGYSRAAEAVDALRRIRDGTYGVCLDCTKKIPAARLQVKPEASRCVACQTEYEQRSAARSGEWRDVTRRSA